MPTRRRSRIALDGEEENLKRKGPFDPPDPAPADAAARAGVAVRAVWQWHSPIEVKQRKATTLFEEREEEQLHLSHPSVSHLLWHHHSRPLALQSSDFRHPCSSIVHATDY